MDLPLHIHFFVQFVHEQGTYFRFHNLAQAIVRADHQVTVHGLDEDPAGCVRTEIRDGVCYKIVPSFPGRRFFTPRTHPANAIRRGLQPRVRGDVAHLFQPFPGALWAWQRSQVRLHAYDWDDLWTDGFWRRPAKGFREMYEMRVVRKLEQTLPRRAALTTTCSRYLADLACRHGANHTSVVHNGIWPQAVPSKRGARQALGLREDAFYAGFMGRTCDELPWCFEAFAAAIKIRPDLRLGICGAPPEVLKDLPGSVRERVDYLGQLAPALARQFAFALDLGLLPLEKNRFNESRFPIKFAEYLGAGLPVLCSQVGECAHLTLGLPGVIPAGDDRAAWLRHFAECIAAGPDALVRPAPDTIWRMFSWADIASRLLVQYREALA
jgi:glycosyltransferase involved in cell wall biosynthesis